MSDGTHNNGIPPDDEELDQLIQMIGRLADKLPPGHPVRAPARLYLELVRIAEQGTARGGPVIVASAPGDIAIAAMSGVSEQLVDQELTRLRLLNLVERNGDDLWIDSVKAMVLSFPWYLGRVEGDSSADHEQPSYTLSPRGRRLALLIRLAEAGEVHEDGFLIKDFRVDMLSSTGAGAAARELWNRELSDLRKRGIVSKSGQGLWIRDLNALRSIVQSELQEDEPHSTSALSSFGRLLVLLIQLAETGDEHAEGVKVSNAPPDKDLASRINTARELVNRTMSILREEGLLKREGRDLWLYDVDALRKMLEDETCN